MVNLAGPNEIPRPNPAFVNRSSELALLDQLTEPGSAARVAVITGVAGAGKSALAHMWAARRRDRFPDGCLNVDFGAMRTPDGTAVADGLADVLRSLGVDEKVIPTSPSARANLYRSTIAEKHCLVLLDDVANAAHVVPFLPNTGSAVVLVTSNSKLIELALDGAMIVELRPLTIDDAVRLLQRHCTDGRIQADTAATSELVRLCSGLPVALRAVATCLLRRPGQSVVDLVSDLRDESRRLDRLAVRGAHDLSVVFDSTFESLDPDVAQLYMDLGALPLRDLTYEIAAVVTDEVRAGDLLDLLVDANLLMAKGDGRFQFHELVRLHARAKALARKSPAYVDGLVAQVLRHCVVMARRADEKIMGDRLRIAGEQTDIDAVAKWFSNRGKAMDWLVAMRANLLVMVRAAVEAGLDDLAWQLAEASTALYLNRRYVADWTESAELGAKAAARAGNPAAEARLRSLVSRAYTDSGDLDRAADELAKARERATQSGHTVLLASVLEFTGRYLEYVDIAAAVRTYEQALAANLDAGSARGAAIVRYFTGVARHRIGDDEQALVDLAGAYDELRALGDTRMAARVQVALGAVYLSTGDTAAADDRVRLAIEEFRELGASYYESEALVLLADVARAGADHEAERAALSRAIELRATAGVAVVDLEQRLAAL